MALPSRSLVVDEERMKQATAFTLKVECQEGNPASKKPVSLIPRVLISNRWRRTS